MPSIDLKGWHILVTRPSPAGEMLAEQIEKFNGHPILLPLIDIVPVDFPKIDLAPFDWVIFISPQAVYHGAEFVRQYLSKNIKVGAIGPGTVQALQAKNLSVDLYPAEDWRSEGLLAMPPMQDVQDKKIALIQGAGGRPFLGETFMKRGAEVTRFIVYQRQLPQLNMDFVQKTKIDIIITTSSEILQNVKILFGSTLCHIPLMVISHKMHDLAEDLGFQKIFVAKNATSDALIAKLTRIIYGK
ncbi:MAG TPA: uroporphyrinogen-III synthase [Gammaproteobacteria bacterium]|jgi:uroporphyrinogen-III synthase|nr:uroporphyrinogen-III synthase [Gammaproteobacteria bacterium]